MKKTLLIAALTMVSASAFASKARLAALQNAAHLTDVQNNFDQPWQVAANGELATVEFGSAGGSPNAEGGFVRQMNDSYLGVYLGHQPAVFNAILGQDGMQLSASSATTSFDTATEIAGVNNPLNIWYAAKAGDITWGVNFFYLTSNRKGVKFDTGATSDADVKTNVMGLSAGATNGVWDASVVLGLTGKTEITDLSGSSSHVTLGGATLASGQSGDITAKSNVNLMGGYKADTLYYYVNYGVAGAKATINNVDGYDLENTKIALGVINSHKKDGTDFFYGASYHMDTAKNKQTGVDYKKEDSYLPLIVGIEAEANNWLVLRGSLTQNLGLIGSTKTSTATVSGDASTLADSTTVAGGVGMKFNKFLVDAFMQTSTTGTFGFDGANFLAKTSLTYNF